MKSKKISPQLKHYRNNKANIDKQHYLYQKRLLTIGRYAVEHKLLDEETLKKIDKFIFNK